MDLIIGGRQTGRTTKAYEYVQMHQDVSLVVASHQERVSLARNFPGIGLPEVVTVAEVTAGRSHRDHLLVDNAQDVLSGLLGAHVEALVLPAGRIVVTSPSPLKAFDLSEVPADRLLAEVTRRLRG